MQRVEPAAQAIITRLRGMAQTPHEVQVEFGLDLHTEAGAFRHRRHRQLQNCHDLATPLAVDRPRVVQKEDGL